MAVASRTCCRASWSMRDPCFQEKKGICRANNTTRTTEYKGWRRLMCRHTKPQGKMVEQSQKNLYPMLFCLSQEKSFLMSSGAVDQEICIPLELPQKQVLAEWGWLQAYRLASLTEPLQCGLCCLPCWEIEGTGQQCCPEATDTKVEPGKAWMADNEGREVCSSQDLSQNLPQKESLTQLQNHPDFRQQQDIQRSHSNGPIFIVLQKLKTLNQANNSRNSFAYK